jgi:hypothetical protein
VSEGCCFRIAGPLIVLSLHRGVVCEDRIAFVFLFFEKLFFLKSFKRGFCPQSFWYDTDVAPIGLVMSSRTKQHHNFAEYKPKAEVSFTHET